MNAKTETALVVPGADNPQLLDAVRTADAANAEASAMVIDSQQMYQLASDEVADLRAQYKAIEAQRVHLKEPFLEGCRRIDALFRVPLDRIEAAASTLKTRMLAFQEAEERKAREARMAREAEERAAREAAEKAQREAAERERLAREEAARVQREAEARAAAERRAAEEAEAAARAAGDEEAAAAARNAADEAAARAAEEVSAAQRVADAAAAQAAIEAEAAQVALDVAQLEPSSLPAVESQAVASSTTVRKTWKVKSVDKAALVLGAADALRKDPTDVALLAYLDVNETALNGTAKALKAAARVPGVVFGEVGSIAAKGGAR